MSSNLEWSCLSRSLTRVTEQSFFSFSKLSDEHEIHKGGRESSKNLWLLCVSCHFHHRQRRWVCFRLFKTFLCSILSFHDFLWVWRLRETDIKHSISETGKFLLNRVSHLFAGVAWYVAIALCDMSSQSHYFRLSLTANHVRYVTETLFVCFYLQLVANLIMITPTALSFYSPSSFSSWSWKQCDILSRHRNVWLIFSPFVLFLIVLPLRMRDVAVK